MSSSFLGGSGYFIGIDLDRSQLIYVRTQFPRANLKLPEVAGTPQDFIRQYKSGDFERFEIVRIAKLSDAALQETGCAAQAWFEWVTPPRKGPPVQPMTDVFHTMVLVSGDKRREFGSLDYREVIQPFSQLLERFRDPQWK